MPIGVLPVAAGGGSSSINVIQANAYTDGDAVYFDGNDWLLADASNAAKLGIGILSNVTAAGFTVNFSGPLSNLPGPYTPGEYYFVSATTPGALTTVEPTATGEYSNPIFFALTTTDGIVLPYRPSQSGTIDVQISVADLAALAAYPDSSYPEGTTAYVQSIRSYFKLGALAVASPMVIVTANSAAASWYRMLDIQDYSWSVQASWEIDSSTGDDENTGAPGDPILTWAEFTRRVSTLNASMLVTLVNNPTSSIIGSFFRGVSTNTTLTIRGTPFTPAVGDTGTFTAASSSVPYAAGANVQGKIAASFNFVASHLGRIVKATIAGATHYAPVLSLDGVRANTTWWTTTTGPTVSQPANGSTIEVMSLPTVGTVQIETDGFLVRVEQLRLTSTDIRDVPYVSTKLYNEVSTPTDYYGFYGCQFETNGLSSGPGDGSYAIGCSFTGIDQDANFKLIPQGGTIFLLGGGSRRLTTNNDVPGRISITGFMCDGRLFGLGATTPTAGIFADGPSAVYPPSFFNSAITAGNAGNGLIVRGQGTVFRTVTLIGANNAADGVFVNVGGTLGITGNYATNPPLLTGPGAANFIVEAPPGVAVGSLNPITNGIPAAAQACTSWATWNGATFNRFAVNLANGSRIVGS